MLNDAQRQQAAALLIEAERTGVPTTQPVSYTHLDVYKRQGYQWLSG